MNERDDGEGRYVAKLVRDAENFGAREQCRHLADLLAQVHELEPQHRQQRLRELEGALRVKSIAEGRDSFMFPRRSPWRTWCLALAFLYVAAAAFVVGWKMRDSGPARGPTTWGFEQQDKNP